MKNRKYELTNESKTLENGVIVYRIKALKDFGDVKAGTLGGFVESEKNLDHTDTCWVYNEAVVYDNARVRDNAKVYDNAVICENALVRFNATVKDNAKISGNASIYDYAIIHNNAEISENASIVDCAEIFDNTVIRCRALINGCAKIYGKTNIFCNAIIGRSAVIKSEKDYVFISRDYITAYKSNDEIYIDETDIDTFRNDVENKYTGLDGLEERKRLLIMVDFIETCLS